MLSIIVFPTLRPIFLILLVFGLTPASLAATTGTQVPELRPFDQAMVKSMRKWKLPGGSLAVVREGKLVLARGYGYVDRKTKARVQPDSLFRIASLSKVITGAAMAKLMEDGAVTPGAQAMTFLLEIPGLEFTDADVRIWGITVEHLLHHRAGFDRAVTGDPMFGDVAYQTRNAQEIVKSRLNGPLQFEPGSRYNYSNFGYSVLGRIIEQASGQSYYSYVNDALLTPLGIKDLRLARSGADGRFPGEVRYHAVKGESAYNLPMESLDSAGGWVASAPSLARLFAAMRGAPGLPELFSPEGRQRLAKRPPRVKKRKREWYGYGLYVNADDRGASWGHQGALPGTLTLAVWAPDGTLWVALFNGRPKKSDKAGAAIGKAFWDAKHKTREWPSHDLSDRFFN